MIYAQVCGNAVISYPLTEYDIKENFPDTSFTSPFIPPDGYVQVREVRKLEVNHTKNVVEGTPVLLSGEWRQTWDVIDASPEEMEARTKVRMDQVKEERNRLLSESDWTQLPDAPVNPEEWYAYRKELRDITSQIGFPWNVEWPIKS